MANRYFLYSKQYIQFRREIESKMGNVYQPGYVIVRGVKKPFTEISSRPTSNRFADAIIVTQGDTELIQYTSPSVIRRGR